MSLPVLPVEDILDAQATSSHRRRIGTSRAGRPLYGYSFGDGPLSVSLIAGCHADEPVGPRTLDSLAGFLASIPERSPWLQHLRWRIVPHVNPDGCHVNSLWNRVTRPVPDHRGRPDRGYAIATYLEHVVRELPGDDIEFGFPRDESDHGARPENLSVAEFLSADGPYDLHGSLHGMGFAPGPWFLIETAWIDRTLTMRDQLRQRVKEMAYTLFDPDRGGEKGFWRIDEGFTTRPDSVAMKQFFDDRGETSTSARFRPSSMEFIRRLGGDPLTFVSEMPLFLTPPRADGLPVQLDDLRRLRSRLDEEMATGGDVEEAARHLEIAPMPIGDQQRLQLAFLDAALRAVLAR